MEKDYDYCFEAYQKAKNTSTPPKNFTTGLWKKKLATILSLSQHLKPSSTSSSSRAYDFELFERKVSDI